MCAYIYIYIWAVNTYTNVRINKSTSIINSCINTNLNSNIRPGSQPGRLSKLLDVQACPWRVFAGSTEARGCSGEWVEGAVESLVSWMIFADIGFLWCCYSVLEFLFFIYLFLFIFFNCFLLFFGTRKGTHRGCGGKHFLERHEVQIAVMVKIVGIAREEPVELRLWRQDMSGSVSE